MQSPQLRGVYLHSVKLIEVFLRSFYAPSPVIAPRITPIRRLRICSFGKCQSVDSTKSCTIFFPQRVSHSFHWRFLLSPLYNPALYSFGRAFIRSDSRLRFMQSVGDVLRPRIKHVGPGLLISYSLLENILNEFEKTPLRRIIIFSQAHINGSRILREKLLASRMHFKSGCHVFYASLAKHVIFRAITWLLTM